jgi:putative oxidoreductase
VRKTIEHFYGLMESGASRLQSPFLLTVRLYWGWQFAQTGWGKFQHLDRVTAFFAQLGIPAPALSAPFIAALELIGGALLAAGVGSRLIALLLTGNMLIAFLTADREALFSIFSDPDKLYAAAPYTYLFASLLILIVGPGKLALSRVIFRRSTISPTNVLREVHP